MRLPPSSPNASAQPQPAGASRPAKAKVIHLSTALGEVRRVLTELGAEFKSVEFPASRQTAVATGMAAMGAEIVAAHRDFFPARASEYGPMLAGMIAQGLKLSPTDMAEAGRVRRNFCGQFERLWADIDLLLVPAEDGGLYAVAFIPWLVLGWTDRRMERARPTTEVREQ